MALAKENTELVITGSNPEKGEKAVKEIIKSTGNENVWFMSCNLSSFKYVKSFVTRIKNKWDSVDVLINNAGVVKQKREITEDGFEYTFQVNYLSHFLLTMMLLDMVKKSKNGRIVNVSSRVEKYAHLDLKDINLSNSYNHIKAYANSKQAQLLFTYEMAEKYPGVAVNAMHPGGVSTGLYGYSPVVKFITGLFSPFMLSPKKGAETLLYLAVSDQVKGVSGRYFIKNKETASSSASYDKNKQKELWDLSRRAVGYHKDAIQKRVNMKKPASRKNVPDKNLKDKL
jgi:NAD(P)-dependent dehydrogenase (short-subunit alcohol dehydrogenase family)